MVFAFSLVLLILFASTDISGTTCSVYQCYTPEMDRWVLVTVQMNPINAMVRCFHATILEDRNYLGRIKWTEASQPRSSKTIRTKDSIFPTLLPEVSLRTPTIVNGTENTSTCLKTSNAGLLKLCINIWGLPHIWTSTSLRWPICPYIGNWTGG